jgi:hypothetical protein
MNNRTACSDCFTSWATLYQQKLYETGQSFLSTNVHILNCLFRSITSTSKGGALSCTSADCLVVESSSFFSCKTSNNMGGAILFGNYNGQCVLHEVCGYDCRTTYSGSAVTDQFAIIQVKTTTSSKNFVNYSSIVRCVNSLWSSYHTMRLLYGRICCPSVNLSMNECTWHSAIICCPTPDSNSFTGSFTYCSFVDNVANGHTCILSETKNANIEFKSCNILRNIQGSLESAGTIYTIDNMMFENSCILENNASIIFYQASSCTITISNCTVEIISYRGSIKVQNTVTKGFIHALNHMSTQNCHSEYDSAEYLTPFMPSPSKQIQCFTYSEYLCQPQTFHSVFIFNFIHPYASISLWY